jgi:hypothetical protein
MSKNTFLAIGSWMAITGILWIVAFIIAESILNFNTLLALVSSLIVSQFTYSIGGVLWLYINYKRWLDGPWKVFLAIVNWMIVVLGLVVLGMGLYASGKAIHDGGGSGSWSCASNSMS